VALLLCAATSPAAGPYSVYSDDPANAFDPPIAKDDARIVEWADGVIDYSPAPGVGIASDWQTGDPMPEVGYRNPTTGIGSLGDLYDPAAPPAVGEIPEYSGIAEPYGGDPADTSDQYGFAGHDDPGSITLGFPHGIRNGPGADFAVFENGSDFGSGLVADLAFVEVSSDGVNFARFDAVSQNTAYLDDTFGASFASIDETNVYNLAGKHLDGWGTPFELDELSGHALVTGGQLDLQDVQYVRIVDVPGIGDGAFVDSQGNPILDASVTVSSGGFDFRLTEGVGVLNAVPEPGSVGLLIAACLAAAGCLIRRRKPPEAS